MQVKLETFTSEEEIAQWLEKKVQACEDPCKPPLLHDNWQLCEYWFVHDGGVKRKRETVVQDQVERNAKDAISSAHCLGLPEEPFNTNGNTNQKQQKALEARHKTGVNKVVQSLNRLGRSILSCEGALPTLKRSLDEKAFKGVKSGLGKCREVKESIMDTLEDYKTITEDMDVDEVIERLRELGKKVQEHHDALQECLSKCKAPGPPPEPIKAEEALEEQGGAPAQEDEGEAS